MLFCFIIDYIDQNETLQGELDDIITGLQGYIETVQRESTQQKVDIEKLSGQKEVLEDRVRKMEAELSILDSEAGEFKSMQQVIFSLTSLFVKKYKTIKNKITQQEMDKITRGEKSGKGSDCCNYFYSNWLKVLKSL